MISIHSFIHLDTLDHLFDVAPTDRAAAVGNLVQSKPPSVMGLPIPSFLVKTFGMRFGDDGATAHDNDKLVMSDMDDECYLGKDGTLEECADFDPPAKP